MCVCVCTYLCVCLVTLTGEKRVGAGADPDWGYSPGASLCSVPGWFRSGSPEPRSGLNPSPNPQACAAAAPSAHGRWANGPARPG